MLDTMIHENTPDWSFDAMYGHVVSQNINRAMRKLLSFEFLNRIRQKRTFFDVGYSHWSVKLIVKIE